MGNSRTRPQDKWDEKAGMVAKTYKVKKEAADAFAECCKANGYAMGIKLSELMQNFVEKINRKTKE